MMSFESKLLSGTSVDLPELERLLDFNVDESDLLKSAAVLLQQCDPESILQEIKYRQARLDHTAALHLSHASVAKPRMYKYCVGHGLQDSHAWRLWLHQYHDNPNPETPHVEGVHNQRYPIASLILRGGYAADEYRLPNGLEPNIDNYCDSLDYWTKHFNTLEHERAVYKSGDVMTLRSSEAHALSNIGAGTLTLVMEFPPVRNFSVAFDGPNHEATKILPNMDRLRDNLLNSL